MSWERVLDGAELREQAPHPVSVAGREICVVRIDGRIYAFDDACPHRQWPLHRGHLEGCVLRCRAHTWEWDVRTGELQRMRAPERLRMHHARERDGAIEVSVDPHAPPARELSPLWRRSADAAGSAVG